MQPNARSTAPMQGLLLHFNFQLCHRVRFWLALGDFRCFQWQTTKHTRANAQSIQRHAWAHTDTDTHTKHTHTCVCVQAKLVKSINMSVHKTRKITRKITRKTMRYMKRRYSYYEVWTNSRWELELLLWWSCCLLHCCCITDCCCCCCCFCYFYCYCCCYTMLRMLSPPLLHL